MMFNILLTQSRTTGGLGLAHTNYNLQLDRNLTFLAIINSSSWVYASERLP